MSEDNEPLTRGTSNLTSDYFHLLQPSCKPKTMKHMSQSRTVFLTLIWSVNTETKQEEKSHANCIRGAIPGLRQTIKPYFSPNLQTLEDIKPNHQKRRKDHTADSTRMVMSRSEHHQSTIFGREGIVCCEGTRPPVRGPYCLDSILRSMVYFHFSHSI